MSAETYNPWTIVNLVFHHLADQGLHPVFGADQGDPGVPAAELLRAFGVTPTHEGDNRVTEYKRDRLAELRDAYERSQDGERDVERDVERDDGSGAGEVSQAESTNRPQPLCDP